MAMAMQCDALNPLTMPGQNPTFCSTARDLQPTMFGREREAKP